MNKFKVYLQWFDPRRRLDGNLHMSLPYDHDQIDKTDEQDNPKYTEMLILEKSYIKIFV